MKQLFAGLPLLLLPVSALLAQDTTPGNDAAGTAAGFLGLGCGCIVWLVIMAVWIGLAVYVYKDAKARGMENAILLTILTLFTGILGFIIYLVMRPKTKIGEPPPGGV